MSSIENNFVSVPLIHVAMGWRTTFENRKCMIDDISKACAKFISISDLVMMVYVVPVEHVVGSDFDMFAAEIMALKSKLFLM